MGLVSIGEFARLSRLSPKALRLYDELGLLVPAVAASPGSRGSPEHPSRSSTER
jgi:DNA-binding transcriptional MerR regulator